EVSARLNQPCNAAQAPFRSRGLHMAEKPICHHHVLRTQNVTELRIARISAEPDNSLLKPRPDPRLIAFYLKHLPQFLVRHALRNPRVLIQFGVPGHVPSFHYAFMTR